MPHDAQDPRLGALDVLIEQERQLITHYEARQAKAEGTATAAVTGVLALAALTGTAARATSHINKTIAWVLVAVLTAVVLTALVVRSVA